MLLPTIACLRASQVRGGGRPGARLLPATRTMLGMQLLAK